MDDMTYQETLKIKNEIESKFKKRLAIFDIVTKEHVAIWFQLPLETYYHYSFDDWIKAKRIWEQCFDLISEHNAKLNCKYGTTFLQLWREYQEKAEELNLPIPKPYRTKL